MRASAVMNAVAEAGAQLEQRAGVRHAGHGGAGVVDAQPVLGHDVAQSSAGRARRRIACGPGRRTGNAAPQPPPRPRLPPARRSRRCRAAPSLGPISSGAKTPRPPPSIMAGPPMPMLLLRVAMITSQQPSSAALPAKQRPLHDADHRHLAVQPREAGEGGYVQAGDDRHVDVARAGRRRLRRTAPPAAGSASARPSMRSVFWWLRMPWVPASTVAS